MDAQQLTTLIDNLPIEEIRTNFETLQAWSMAIEVEESEQKSEQKEA